MKMNFSQFFAARFHNTVTATINIFIFLPYYFSVETLTKTLFRPWKNIVTKKSTPGFSFGELFGRMTDNVVSRGIGFFVRSSYLILFLLLEMFLVIFLPLIFFVAIVTAPMAFWSYSKAPTDEEKKKMIFDEFVKRHLGDEAADQPHVVAWFDSYYAQIVSQPWWDMKTLMNQPPMGRDLLSGFTPQLDKFSIDLTVQKPHYQHMIGRTQEIQLLQNVLIKSGGANAILVGNEGVGRYTIIEALAKAIHDGTSDTQLAFKRILEVDIEKILGDVTDPIIREQTVDEMFAEAQTAGNVIIFIHNIDKYVSQQPGALDLSAVITKYASQQSIQFVATTTPYLYQKHIYSNQTIAATFTKIDVNEMSVDDTIKILQDVTLQLEKKHNVAITYGALEAAALLSGKFIAEIPFPEKAIQLLDESCIYALHSANTKAVNRHIVNASLQQKIKIPTELSAEMKTKLLQLETQLRKRVLHQEEALQVVSASLRKAFVMVGSRQKPLATFLFLGPTGVGKTETARAITEVFFQDQKNMLRFDMSLYQSINDIPKLIGSPESGEAGLMTEAIRQQKFGTLLLDELEKAHKDLINIFLTVLDEGYFTDGYGRRVDCSNMIIIATSNAGADFIYQRVQNNTAAGLSYSLIDHLVQQKIYTPEFLNRFDAVLVYKPLNAQAVTDIAQVMLNQLAIDVKAKHGVSLTFSPQFVQDLIKNGYDPRFGARNMQRIIRSQVEDTLAKKLLEGSLKSQQQLQF